MAFSYDPAALTVPLNYVRFRIGDTTETEPPFLFHDSEIEAILTDEGDNVLCACERLVEGALAKVARDVDSSGAGLNTTRSQKTTHLQDVLTRIRNDITSKATPRFTGNSQSALDDLLEDDDTRVLFRLSQIDDC
mgnify:CR=1 FL=1